MPIPLVILIVIAALGLFIWQRMRLKQSLEQNQDKNFGAVAERLGMRVEAGDPNTSLLYSHGQRRHRRTIRDPDFPNQEPLVCEVIA